MVPPSVNRGRGAWWRCGVPEEESSVDPGEAGHINQAVSVLGLDVIPVPGIQVGPGARVGGPRVAYVGDANSEGYRVVRVEGCGQPLASNWRLTRSS